MKRLLSREFFKNRSDIFKFATLFQILFDQKIRPQPPKKKPSLGNIYWEDVWQYSEREGRFIKKKKVLAAPLVWDSVSFTISLPNAILKNIPEGMSKSYWINESTRNFLNILRDNQVLSEPEGLIYTSISNIPILNNEFMNIIIENELFDSVTEYIEFAGLIKGLNF
jgi:hypothetical protein